MNEFVDPYESGLADRGTMVSSGRAPLLAEVTGLNPVPSPRSASSGSEGSGAAAQATSTLGEGFGEGNEPGVAPEIPAGGKLRPETTRLRAAMTRLGTVERGRRLGEDTAVSRREVGTERTQRIARAMAYAAWEYDGKPESSLPQQEEFGVADAKVTASLDRASFGRPTKKTKK